MTAEQVPQASSIHRFATENYENKHKPQVQLGNIWDWWIECSLVVQLSAM